MKRHSAVAFGCAAVIVSCGGQSRQPAAPSGPSGATETQGTSHGVAVANQPEASTGSRQVPLPMDILRAARENEAYRRVVITGAKTQLALMTIPTGSDIGMEAHPNVEQMFFIASGQGQAVVNGTESPVRTGDVVVAPPGTRHNIINTGTEPLRIYTIYAPPNHIDGRVHPTKAAANADTADDAFGRAAR